MQWTYDPKSRRQGDALEEFIFEYLENEIKTHRFPFVTEHCKLYRGKKYWSESRKSYIPCDISIEIFLEQSAEYSLLWIWECKDWSRPVGVGTFEEFHGKLQQLGSDNTKGTVVVCNGITKPAFNYAASNKIGIFKVEVVDECSEAKVSMILSWMIPGKSNCPNRVMDGILCSGQEAAFRPPDKIYISHDAGACLQEYTGDCLGEWFGEIAREKQIPRGMKGRVIRYKVRK